MKRKFFVLSAFTLLFLVILTGCVPGDGTYTSVKLAGFFWGIWHGWIAPISLVMGLFNHNIRIYEVVNSGWWYDFGFFMAIISGFGGLSLTRRRQKKDKDN